MYMYMYMYMYICIYVYLYTPVFKKRCFFKNICHIYNYAFSALASLSFFVNTRKDIYVYRKKKL